MTPVIVEYADVVAPTMSNISPTANSRKRMALWAFSVMPFTSATWEIGLQHVKRSRSLCQPDVLKAGKGVASEKG